jgi:fatty-acyl-CoA synthase
VWDEVGNINIVDRKKDVIISGGENISSPEIEARSTSTQPSSSAPSSASPTRSGARRRRLLVVLRSATRDRGGAPRVRRERLAHFKCPTSVEFILELPRTATGKLQKFKLREQYWQGTRR